jgi:hypothetical protein
MNLFTLNSPYYHLVKYLLSLLKHPVYFTSPVCYVFRLVANLRQLTTKQLRSHGNKIVLKNALHVNAQITLKCTLYNY